MWLRPDAGLGPPQLSCQARSLPQSGPYTLSPVPSTGPAWPLVEEAGEAAVDSTLGHTHRSCSRRTQEPGAPLPQRRHMHTRLPHAHGQCLQELLGTHSASAAAWPIASSGAWLWLPTLQPPIGHSALWPHPALLLTAVWPRPLRPPWDQAGHSHLHGTETGLLQPPSSSTTYFHYLQRGRNRPPPTLEGTEAERTRTPGNWARMGGAMGERQAGPASLGAGDCSPLPLCHFHLQTGGGCRNPSPIRAALQA